MCQHGAVPRARSAAVSRAAYEAAEKSQIVAPGVSRQKTRDANIAEIPEEAAGLMSELKPVSRQAGYRPPKLPTTSAAAYAARESASAVKRVPWALPEQGLTVFHGHPDVPRLFHYFLPRLIAQGRPVLCLDGANRFDPLLIARFARERGLEAAVFNQRIRVARAFTCFQLTELVVRAPRWLEKFPARAVVVTALPDLYFDEDVREREAAATFQRAFEALRALQRQRTLATAVFCDAGSFQTPRKTFFAQLLARADQVSRFVVEPGDHLALVGEKFSWPAPRALPQPEAALKRVPSAARPDAEIETARFPREKASGRFAQDDTRCALRRAGRMTRAI